MNSSQIILNCSNGFTLYAKNNNLVIVNKRNEEIIPIEKIQSFSLKEPGSVKPGMIVFRTAQAASSGINVGFGIGVAIGAEKTFFFSKAEIENARKIRDCVVNFNVNQAPQLSETDKVVSVVDEIRGLKSLLDEGIITQKEFDTKKKQLLGL